MNAKHDDHSLAQCLEPAAARERVLALARRPSGELLDALREQERQRTASLITRTEWAEARHEIRWASQDLSGLHTELERRDYSWLHLTAELDTVIARLTALRQYLIPVSQRGPA